MQIFLVFIKAMEIFQGHADLFYQGHADLFIFYLFIFHHQRELFLCSGLFHHQRESCFSALVWSVQKPGSFFFISGFYSYSGLSWYLIQDSLRFLFYFRLFFSFRISSRVFLPVQNQNDQNDYYMISFTFLQNRTDQNRILNIKFKIPGQTRKES